MVRLVLFSVLLVCLGLGVLYLLSRRRFLRRGETGLERFAWFEQLVLIRLLEGLLRLLAWVAVLSGLILLGVVCFNWYV